MGVPNFQVEDTLFGLEQALKGPNITSLEFNTHLNALNSSWQAGLIGLNSSGQHSVILQDLRLGINLVAIRVNGEQVIPVPQTMFIVWSLCVTAVLSKYG